MAARLRSVMRFVLPVLALIAVLAAAWWLLHRPGTDDAARWADNNRGVALMEQFQFKEAAAAFDEVARKHPDWLPGHVNRAIALLNQQEREALDRAAAIMHEVLAKDAASNHADHCLGIIRYHEGDLEAARRHFGKVVERDPDDPHARYFLARTLEPGSPDVKLHLEKVLALDPYLLGALYSLWEVTRLEDQAKAHELLRRFKELSEAEWTNPVAVKYGEMGKYAEVIGRQPRPPSVATGPLPLLRKDDAAQVILADGVSWTSGKDVLGAAAGSSHKARSRFGGAMAVFDYDGDGKLDVFLAGGAFRGGELRDLLLRNEGPGKLRDATAEAGLAGLPASAGCVVADYDNDAAPDLLLTGAFGIRLLRNVTDGKQHRFQDVTRQAGLEDDKAASLGATLVDIDQDSDLDVLADRGGKIALYLNVGEAVAQTGAKKVAPLATKFRRADELLPKEMPAAVNLAIGDLDSDRDIDVLLLGDRGAPVAVLNDRLLKFHARPLPEQQAPAGAWNGAAVLDVNRDERSDLFLVGHQQKPALLIQGPGGGEGWFSASGTSAPVLRQAQAVDLDLDGWCDVVGLSDQRVPVLLHNQGGKLAWVREALGTDKTWGDVTAVLACDLDNLCKLDLLVWSESQGLHVHRNQGNGNQGLPVTITGLRDKGTATRTSSDAIGARISAQVRDHWTVVELATFHAGLGQSRQPLLLGLGKAAHADFVSLRWPDGVWQAELNLPACQHAVVRETNRKGTSCPLLFAWNGAGHAFITDFIGAGTVGEPLPGGGHRPPRPEESIALAAEQLAVKDGRYWLKITEPMDEVVYLDRLQLVAIDHPQALNVYPDERFPTGTTGPTQDLLFFAHDQRIFPAARDHKGREKTQALRHWDRDTVDRFAKRAWIGWAEEHWVELDFGAQLARFDSKHPLGLFLAAWTDYPYPESMLAASQAGFALLPPVLERLSGDGTWRAIAPDLSFPAGMPRMMTYDVTGLVAGDSCKLRIRTNMHVYWDQVFVAPLTQRIAARELASAKPPSELQGRGAAAGAAVRVLAVQAAHLESRGCAQEYSPDGKLPTLYAYDRLDRVPVTRLAGRLTRLGGVTELLHERDDCFVIFGPGDELTVTFAADALPPLPAGWQRSFVLDTCGYCKDASPFTATGGTVEPLPFQAMKTFPYGPSERYPQTPRHEDYQRRYNTRVMGRGLPTVR
jgi:tetratricopeptide (TPR) repeat protein